jgi:hypothetical protein
MGVFFQLIIREINLRHDLPFTGQARPKNIATKAIRHKGYIYYSFFVPYCRCVRMEKVLSTKTQNPILMDYP